MISSECGNFCHVAWTFVSKYLSSVCEVWWHCLSVTLAVFVDCRAAAHGDCRDLVPLPCIPSMPTPSGSKHALAVSTVLFILISFSALTLLFGLQEGHPTCKKYGGCWRWALVSPDGVAPSRMVGVSASVNLPLHHKVQKYSSGTSSRGWSRKKGRKMVVEWWYFYGRPM